MSNPTIKEKLLRLTSQIKKNDANLGKELVGKKNKSEYEEEARKIAPFIKSSGSSEESLESFEVMDVEGGQEAVILRVGRPVLTIFSGEAQLIFQEAESEIWRERLINAKDKLATTIPSVGRIEIQNHPIYIWGGTGWLVDKNIVVTNRHVAELFGRNNGIKFIFRQGTNGEEMHSSIDLLQEAGRSDQWVFRLVRIIHIEPEPGPDIAFLRVEEIRGAIPDPLILDTETISELRDVALIGYPAKDSRMPDLQLMEQIFGEVFDKKRLAPGQVTKVINNRLFHDCSTLGGCSGSAVIDLLTGKAVGLHFAGRFLESNFAVPASIVAQKLQMVNGPVSSTSKSGILRESSIDQVASKSPTTIDQDKVVSNQYSVTVPLQVTFTFGQPLAGTPQAQTKTNSPIVRAVTEETDETDEDELITEGVREDYKDREGYNPDFLGEGFEVPLPEVKSERKKEDILKYDNNGEQDHVLRYEHFSVVMNKARRICFFSAVNIDGRTARGGISRVGWRLDPRISKTDQIIKECYGNAPKFSRGHMTRREDPVWGSEISRFRGNADSMCVTNATPQMQSFNTPVWLALEDHALDNSRDDKMRISVFTGPIMKPNDPVKFGVKIPVEFWKVIAFIHDETGELCATGYKMSQNEHLPDEEFVFGSFGSSQISIKKIEKLTGLIFGDLSNHDPLNNTEESLEGAGMVKPLKSVMEVRFI